MRDFTLKNAKIICIFGTPPPQTPLINVGKVSTFGHSPLPHLPTYGRWYLHSLSLLCLYFIFHLNCYIALVTVALLYDDLQIFIVLLKSWIELNWIESNRNETNRIEFIAWRSNFFTHSSINFIGNCSRHRRARRMRVGRANFRRWRDIGWRGRGQLLVGRCISRESRSRAPRWLDDRGFQFRSRGQHEPTSLLF